MGHRPLIYAIVSIVTLVVIAGAQPFINWPGNDAGATSTEHIVTVEADTWVRETHPDKNYGNQSFVHVDGNPDMRSYLRFSVEGLSGTVTRATLQIFAEARHRDGFTVHSVADNAWDEYGITYSSAPAFDASAISQSGPFNAGDVVSVDVTPAVTGNGRVSFALDSVHQTRMKFSSRESGQNAPKLVIEVSEPDEPSEPDPTPTPEPDPTPTPESDSTEPPDPDTSPSEVVVTADADTWVNSSDPGTNYGERPFVYVDGDPEMRGYLRFDVSGISGTVIGATLELVAESRHSSGFAVHPVGDDSWDEYGVTFANAPGYDSAAIAHTDPFDAGDVVRTDVTSQINGDGVVSLALVSNHQTRLKLSSRESGENAPRLVIEVSGSDEPSEPDPDPSPDESSLELPIRAIFYYPWFPNAWDQGGMEPYTQFTPSLGEYDSSDPETINAHVEMMEHAQIEAAIASWWGQGHHTDDALDAIMDLDHNGFKWSIYHEEEGHEDLSPDEIREDLTYIRDRYASDSDYLRVDDKFVVFVYNADDTSCEVADRWVPVAEDLGVCLSLKVFSGYEDCANQPDAWHQYGPATAESHHQDSFNISPGFYHADEDEPRLERDLDRWAQNVQNMVASGEPWQLVTSFNEWGEGTIVEESEEFGTDYLDVLAANGTGDTGPEPDDGDSGDDGNNDSGDGSYTTLIAASDIAYEGDADEKSAQMVDELLQEYPDLYIQTAGDNVQGDAEWEEYDEWYDESWGRFLDRTHAAIGNHDYLDDGEGENYYRYFGEERGGPMDKFYYSYDLPNNWHVVVINANNQLHEWEPGTEQYEWLAGDLEANKDRNIFASWHQPRYTSGYTDDYDRMSDIWALLDEYNAEFVISGHTHLYERYLPQDGDGNVKPDGVVQFGVGTTSSPRDITSLDENAEVVIEETQGLVLFRLYDDHYEWEFIPLDPDDQTDSGSAPVIP